MKEVKGEQLIFKIPSNRRLLSDSGPSHTARHQSSPFFPDYSILCCCHAKSCPTLCNPVVYCPPDSVHRISQARILEWVAISFSRGSSQPRDQTHVSCVARSLHHESPEKSIPCVLGSCHSSALSPRSGVKSLLQRRMILTC